MSTPVPIRRYTIWLISAGLAGLASWLFLRGQPSGLPVDDAYIHLVYAQNLAKGLGWCFNAGEPSLGTSSPLWVVLIRCLLPWFTPEMAVRGLAFVALVVTTVLISDLAWLVSRGIVSTRIRSVLGLSGAALFAISGNLLWITFCGMESIVFLMLGLMAIRGMASGKPGALTGICLALIVLTRIEGALLFFLLLGWWFWRLWFLGWWFRRLSRMGQARMLAPTLWFLPALLAWSAWTAYSWLRFSQFMPSTMAGKLAANLFNAGWSPTGAGLFIYRHLAYLSKWDNAVFHLLWFSLIGLVGLIIRHFRGARFPGETREDVPLAALVSGWALLNLLLHAFCFRSTAALTPYHYLRYQVPLFPAVCLGGFWTLAFLLRRAPTRFFASLLGISIIGVLALFSFLRWRPLYAQNVSHLQQSHQAAALWAKANLPEDARLACFDIGSLKYFSGRYVIDLGGLTDPAIDPYLREKRVGPYLVQQRATHYLALDRPPEEIITGARKDDGALYRLKELARFDAPDYPTPVRLHSLAVVIYEIDPHE